MSNSISSSIDAAGVVPDLRILHLEDDENDAQLVRSRLLAGGLSCTIKRVETRTDFESALEKEPFELIISDFTLPSFDGMSALTHSRKVKPDLPFIFVSGTIGEEAAVESLKCGATDYVLKDRLSRLVASVRRALQETQTRAEQRRNEDKVREQAALLDKARDAIFVTDMEMRILYRNKAAERMYGSGLQESTGRGPEQLVFGKRGAQSSEALKELFQRDEWKGELQKSSEDGRQNIVESHWSLLRDDSGHPKSILVIDTDITEKKQLETQFLRMQRMQSIGALAGGIAHDLNNVLAPILMVTELLRDELTSEESRQRLDTAKASAQRGAEMVKQILAFSQGAGGELRTIQLKHLIADMVRLMKDTFPRSIRVESRMDKELRPVLGDVIQLNQVLLNLCVNARDAMPKGGTLQIGAYNTQLEGKRMPTAPEPVTGRFVLLTVADTGVGISQEVLHRIFEPFFTTKEAGKGTGLGLSTVLGIIRSCHGFVEVASEVGKGTIFEVYLPVAVQGDADAIHCAVPAVDPGQGETILLVDDEAAVLEMTRATLEAFNYKVITAQDGADALILFQQHVSEIDVVITDMDMPVMDGESLIRQLRVLAPGVRVICVSGLALEANLKEVAGLHPQAFLTKPYTSEKLLTTLKSVAAFQ